jgi:hypothetical protein
MTKREPHCGTLCLIHVLFITKSPLYFTASLTIDGRPPSFYPASLEYHSEAETGLYVFFTIRNLYVHSFSTPYLHLVNSFRVVSYIFDTLYLTFFFYEQNSGYQSTYRLNGNSPSNPIFSIIPTSITYECALVPNHIQKSPTLRVTANRRLLVVTMIWYPRSISRGCRTWHGRTRPLPRSLMMITNTTTTTTANSSTTIATMTITRPLIHTHIHTPTHTHTKPGGHTKTSKGIILQLGKLKGRPESFLYYRHWHTHGYIPPSIHRFAVIRQIFYCPPSGHCGPNHMRIRIHPQ